MYTPLTALRADLTAALDLRRDGDDELNRVEDYVVSSLHAYAEFLLAERSFMERYHGVWIFAHADSNKSVADAIRPHRTLVRPTWSVPLARKMNAMLLPVRSALAGHTSMASRLSVTATSTIAHVMTVMRIWVTETLKPSTVCPSTCSVMMVAESLSRGSRRSGSTTGMARPPKHNRGPALASSSGYLPALTVARGRQRVTSLATS